MSIRSVTGLDLLDLTFNPSLGTNDFSMGMWVKRYSDRNTYAILFVMCTAEMSPASWMGLFLVDNGTQLMIGCGPGTWTSGYETVADTWYWGVASRTGGVLTCRVFDDSASTTPLGTYTAPNTENYTFTRVRIGDCWGTNTYYLDGELANAKLHIGTAWTNAQCRAESQTFAPQNNDGTRLSYKLENNSNTVHGIQEAGSVNNFPGTTFSNGSSRPSQLQPVPFASVRIK